MYFYVCILKRVYAILLATTTIREHRHVLFNLSIIIVANQYSLLLNTGSNIYLKLYTIRAAAEALKFHRYG